MEEKRISSAVIKRLPRYYRYLNELLEQGTERISSQELSKEMNLTASQIRQDFNHFGGFGQQGYGYNVKLLHEEIGKILGLNRQYNVIVIGAGKLGQALANYSGFQRRGFQINGIFDVNEEIIGKTVHRIRVQNMKDVAGFIEENQVQIAALTVPKSQAPKIAKVLYQYGVRAFWNFASTDLNLPQDALVENVHLVESLMRLSYRISNPLE